MQNSGEGVGGFFAKHTIAIIMWGLLIIIGILLFSDFSRGPTVVSEKTEPYALSTKGKTLILRDKQLVTIAENQTGSIQEGDKIKTLDATTSIYWPDGSVTRLAEQSVMKIHTMEARTANEDIQIDFSLEQGKSWSNVIKYYFGDSYFHERFNEDTALAAVRGTVFEVNLDRKYIHTIDHAVSIEDIGSHTGSTFVVAGGVFDTETREELVQGKIDEAWNQANTASDVIYINQKMEALKQAIFASAGKQNYLGILLQKLGLQKESPSLEVLLTGNPTDWERFATVMKSGDKNQELLDIYQQFYGLQNTKALLDTKMRLRDLIIETAPSEKKALFLSDFARSTLYDSWKAIELGSGSAEELKTKLGDYLQQGADPEMINALRKAATSTGVQNLNNKLEGIKQDIIGTFGQKNLLEEAKQQFSKENIQKVNSATDTVRNSFTDWLKKIIQ